MKYLNYYNSLYENVSSLTSYNNWSIDYNDENHDLNIRLIQRSNIRDTSIFSKLVEKIINSPLAIKFSSNYDLSSFNKIYLTIKYNTGETKQNPKNIAS